MTLANDLTLTLTLLIFSITLTLTLRIGEGQWTERLMDLAKVLNKDEVRRLVINIDGPYGVSMQPHNYRSILLVAGGIGITPLVASYKHLALGRYIDSS